MLRREGESRPAARTRACPAHSRVSAGLLGSVAALVLAALILLTAAPASASAASTFPDVGKGHVAYDAIEYMAGAGIISGYNDGSFGPEKTLTRGQATKILVLWRDVPLNSGGPYFSDLDVVYGKYVRAAAAQGWITGYPDGRFRAYDTLTREQMAIIMVRAMGWDADALKLSGSRIAEILSAFSDEANISTNARPYAALAVERGLFNGSNGEFKPKDGITRAQFSLVVFRAELSMMAVIQRVSVAGDYPDRTRVVIELSRAPGSVVAAISADGTLTVDYAGGAIAGTLSQAIDTAEVKSVGARQLAYHPRTVRITLKLGRYRTFRVMSLAPAADEGSRIVVDVAPRVDGPEGDGPPLICVDAGHGGIDSGAVGATGSYEKDFNLSIALLLARDLRDAGLRVIMTREEDILPGATVSEALHRRAEIANTARANLFVSVHNNAAGDPEAEGTETFYWGTPDDYSVEGRLLAEAIQRNLLEAIDSVDRGARTHWYNLVVLAETDMPAALAEVGFVTNPEEEALLKDPAYQKAGAQGIANGVLEYLKWSSTVYTSE